MSNFKKGDSVFFIGGETAISNGIIFGEFTPNKKEYFEIRYFDCDDIKTISFPSSMIFKTFEEALDKFVCDLKDDIFIIPLLNKEQYLMKDFELKKDKKWH